MTRADRADDWGMSSINALPAVTPALVQDRVGIAVARKILDVAEQQGAASIALIQSAAKIVQNVGSAAADGGGATGIDLLA